MLFCVIVLLYCIVLYFTALYCTVLKGITLPPGINPFLVNNNNNNNSYVLDNPRKRRWIPSRLNTGSGPHPATYSSINCSSFSGVKVDGA
jgi:hypothetical protein